ncbi:MAG: radical SAM protein [Chloroflexi bacterium]|nr:radical SAM protein [Chloroflexota bacterium]
MAAGVIFEEIECKSIINRVQATGMPFKWSINPYRGCQHACVYCFARGTHQYLGYDSGRDFDSRIIVKTNAAAVLQEQLRRPGWTREMILLGTACDPYQQAEIKYGITRSILEVLFRFAQPVHMLTKSPTVLRDLELWTRLASVTDAQIAFSVPTLDEDVWRKLEPGTSRPIKRLQAMRQLVDAGVPCGVMLAPVVPGVTDDEPHLEAVIRAAAEHGARFVAPNVLHLRPGTKEWFMPALRAAYPHLLPRYQRFYRGAYAPKHYTQQVLAKVAELQEKWGLNRPRVDDRPSAGQLRLTL